MAGASKIEWTDATWNAIVGCSIVSPGCTNCYAMKMAARIERMRVPERRGDIVLPHHYSALTQPSKAGPVWTGRVNIAPNHILTQPLHWKKPRRIFVNSMGDLFHESIPDEWIDRVFAVMALCPQHTFQVLTKRAGRMREYMTTKERGFLIAAGPALEKATPSPRPWSDKICKQQAEARIAARNRLAHWPLRNVWLGVSTERQQEADERIPHLLATPAAVRFISAEPLLGPIDLTPKADATYQRLSEWYGPKGFDPEGAQPRRERITGFFPRLDWVIVGGESGPRSRSMHPRWVRSLRDQCAAASVPFFFKQWGAWRQSDDAADRMIVSDDGDVDIPDNRAADESADEVEMARVGKKAAGRLLDGKEHNEFPRAREAKAA